MGNKAVIDMGNSFQLISALFHTHDVAKDFFDSATAGVCEVGLEGPTKHVTVVPLIRQRLVSHAGGPAGGAADGARFVQSL
jgi:hypothetical protein